MPSQMGQQRKPPWRETLSCKTTKAKAVLRSGNDDEANPYHAVLSILPTDLYEEKRAFAAKTCRGKLPLKPDKGREPYGVQIDNNIPLGIYDTDRGRHQGIAKAVASSQQTYAPAFKSRRGRFLGVPNYKLSTHAINAKEPYANPEQMGPGTYKLRPTTLVIKHLHEPGYTFTSQVDRFESPQRPYAESATTNALPSTLGKAPVSTVAVSMTPRFTSDSTFPENYASSKHQRIFYPPDIVYDKPLIKGTIQDRVATTHVKYSAMTSQAGRLVSTASMVHNAVGVPRLQASTSDALGPGAYATPSTFAKPETSSGALPQVSEHSKDRFGMKATKHAQCIETRFRRFCVS
ncbi:hypothetical protein SPRG_18802 [Saprolegnia parasitica CBS 223.65]|uniref:Uncharacterized protein n=1 Tax=Saprolegnia parasitica (strain CBS 223.65) TaxID=695850 RepID=A0A067DAF0_SAPPC|nr:hypothetical protein SPRG_18802 [Saprolegnia parasitica CBS 223.65]KDO35601.1 hypothetical protein SPRG_18802 [Saprolegnia parasitica CBS 223.65]|eukprot:XP_012194021.1 hypothetical protein SPRG_18802 [Saprolegnia parasitica CBS 223.65]